MTMNDSGLKPLIRAERAIQCHLGLKALVIKCHLSHATISERQFCRQNGAVAVHRAKKQWRIVLKGTAATDF